MGPEPHENQLELFDVTRQAAPRPHRETLGRVLIQLRHDQLVVCGIAGLIGLAVVFACGVERGKQLVRFERAILARQRPSTAQPQTPETAPPAATPAPSESAAETGKPPAKPAQKVKTPTRVASTAPSKLGARPSAASRYAVQVVTFRQVQSARRELERLQARGERAFLVMREGRTGVFVGPFPSRDHASAKLVKLRTQYQDCFLKTL